jgi:hypothetical protein
MEQFHTHFKTSNKAKMLKVCSTMEVLALLIEYENCTHILQLVFKYTMTCSRNIVQPNKHEEKTL